MNDKAANKGQFMSKRVLIVEDVFDAGLMM
jgi:hypoxanthine-guanine phosphoribosyltransferase